MIEDNFNCLEESTDKVIPKSVKFQQEDDSIENQENEDAMIKKDCNTSNVDAYPDTENVNVNDHTNTNNDIDSDKNGEDGIDIQTKIEETHAINDDNISKIIDNRNTEASHIPVDNSGSDEDEEEDKINDDHSQSQHNINQNTNQWPQFVDGLDIMGDYEQQQDRDELPSSIDVKHEPIPKSKNLLMMEKLEKEIDSIIHKPKPEDVQVASSKTALEDYETLASKDDDVEDNQPTLIIRQHLPDDINNKTPKLAAEDDFKKRQTKPPVPRQPKLKSKKKGK